MNTHASNAGSQFLDLSSNEKLILDYIWRYGPVSRKSLAELTGLTGASTSRLTKHALSIGLIEESVAHSGTVGSPSRPLQRASHGVYSIGVSFARNSIECAVSDLSGQLTSVNRKSVSGIEVSAIAEEIATLINESRPLAKRNARLLGVGVAIPGYRADTEGEWAAHWDFPNLLTRNISKELSNSTGLPVFVERDAIACLWSEHLNGAFRTLRDFCLVYLSQGVGGAVMADGRVVYGHYGNAGGFGALFPYNQPRPSAANLAGHLGIDVDEFSALPEVLNAPAAAVDQWVEQVTPALSSAVTVLARLFDPGTIVLSGSLPTTILQKLAISIESIAQTEHYTALLPLASIHATQSKDHGRLLSAAATLPFAHVVNQAIRS